jgi:hypothetical protein
MEQAKSIRSLTPNLEVLDAYSDIELTEEETQLALLEARQKKSAKLRQEEYLKKLRKEVQYQKFCAEELQEQVKSISGFVVDEFNEDLIWQMCLYFSGDKRCLLDAKKGLFLYGGTGCGKTTLMEFFRFNQVLSFAVIPVLPIAADYQKNGSDAILRYKALFPSSDILKSYGQDFIGVCFDDLGVEVDQKHFGNESNVMADILLTRYDRMKSTGHNKTHITSNLNSTQLGERYGERVRSRLREMCNVLIFPDGAPDRRK